MNALNLNLDDELWTDACREAATRAVDVDALLADVLTTHFARWMTPDEAADARDPDLRLRLALAACEAAEQYDPHQAEALAAIEAALYGRLDPPPDGTEAEGCDASLHWSRAISAAIADDMRARIERLEQWQAVFRAGERASVRAQHREAVDRYREALALADDAMVPRIMTLERLARSHLMLGQIAPAARAARRAMVLAGQRGLPHSTALAHLSSMIETVRSGHPAVQQMVAGLVALDQSDAGTAVERLVEGADIAARAGATMYEMRARSALAAIRLAAGAGAAASGEARRAAALAREASLDELAGMLDVLATAGARAAPDSPGRPVFAAGEAQSAGQGSSSIGS